MAIPPGFALFSLLTYDYKHCATILQELEAAKDEQEFFDVVTGFYKARRNPP